MGYKIGKYLLNYNGMTLVTQQTYIDGNIPP